MPRPKAVQVKHLPDRDVLQVVQDLHVGRTQLTRDERFITPRGTIFNLLEERYPEWPSKVIWRKLESLWQLLLTP